MSNAQERALFPPHSHASKQLAPPLTIESPKRLVEDHEPHPRSQQRPCDPYSLAFASRDKASPFTKQRLQSIWKFFQDPAQRCRFDHWTKRHDDLGAGAVPKIIKERTIPKLHGRIDP